MRLLNDPAFLSSTIAAIYDCVPDPARWQVVIPQLADMIGARRAALGVMTAAGEFAFVSVMHGYDGVERMLEYAPLNPVIPVAMVHPFDKALVASRDLTMPPLQSSRFYREYLAPNNDLDAIGFILTREGNAFGNWALVTQTDRGPITEAEATGLELIAPHVRRAVEISRLLGVQRVQSDTYRDALGQLDSPVLILDGTRRLLHANARGEAALAAGTVLQLRSGTLSGATESAEAALRRAADHSLAGGASGFEASVMGSDGEERLLFAVAFETSADRWGGSPRRSVMLVMRAPLQDTRNPIAVAARTFNLTTAQVQVLSFLAQGHDPGEIADILGITITTVRTHLSDLFGKTGTSRQAELVARSLSLISPLRQDDPHR